MADQDQNPTPIGRLVNLVQDARDTWRLLWDPHVPIWTKLIPLASVLYLVWPIDLLADPILGLGQLDDLAITVLGMKAFIAVCSLPGVYPGTHESTQRMDSSAETIDAEYRVLDDTE